MSEQLESQNIFPDDFNITTSEKAVNSSMSFDKIRTYIKSNHDKSINTGLEYFYLNLKDYPSLMREKVMTELLTKFKYIAVPKPINFHNDTQLLLTVLRVKDYDFKNRYLEKVTKINPDNYLYLVALTSDFGERMTTYTVNLDSFV